MFIHLPLHKKYLCEKKKKTSHLQILRSKTWSGFDPFNGPEMEKTDKKRKLWLNTIEVITDCHLWIKQ